MKSVAEFAANTLNAIDMAIHVAEVKIGGVLFHVREVKKLVHSPPLVFAEYLSGLSAEDFQIHHVSIPRWAVTLEVVPEEIHSSGYPEPARYHFPCDKHGHPLEFADRAADIPGFIRMRCKDCRGQWDFSPDAVHVYQAMTKFQFKVGD